MKIFYYFGHASQFYFHKNAIKVLKERGNEIFIYIKTKDVLRNLIEETGWPYRNILPDVRKNLKLSITWSLIKRDIALMKEVLKFKPDLFISSDPSFSHLGFLFNKPSINFIDDDIDVIGFYSMVTYPFTTTIVTPKTVRVGKWEFKRIGYNGYMKLAYLHPNWFKPNEEKIHELKGQPYFLIRLTGLTAYHDDGIKGIEISTLKSIISGLSNKGKVFISSEEMLGREFQQYKLTIPVADIHHYLYFAQALISDSQSMSGEAAMLGTPSIRISTFASRLSVLEELEHEYRLTFGIKPENEKAIFDKINEILEIPNFKKEFQLRRKKMLDDKIDVTAFTIWFIENYPKSKEFIEDKPEFWKRFR